MDRRKRGIVRDQSPYVRYSAPASPRRRRLRGIAARVVSVVRRIVIERVSVLVTVVAPINACSWYFVHRQPILGGFVGVIFCALTVYRIVRIFRRGPEKRRVAQLVSKPAVYFFKCDALEWRRSAMLDDVLGCTTREPLTFRVRVTKGPQAVVTLSWDGDAVGRPSHGGETFAGRTPVEEVIDISPVTGLPVNIKAYNAT